MAGKGRVSGSVRAAWWRSIRTVVVAVLLPLPTTGAVLIDKLGLAQGLSDTTVFSLIQDDLGRLWFGTASGGVNRYDGYGFRVYLHDGRQNALSHSDAGLVFQDSRGRIWIGTWGGGLNRYREALDGFEQLNPGAPPHRIQSVAEDAGGTLWVGSSDDGLFRLLPDGQVLEPVLPADGLAPDRIWSIAAGGNDDVWVAASSGLYRVRDSELIRHATMAEDHPRALAVLADTLWIGTTGGLYRLPLPADGKLPQRVDLPVSAINALTVDQGRLLICSFLGLRAVDPLRIALVPPLWDDVLEPFQGQNLRAALRDRSGMLWLATREGGVIRVRRQYADFGGYASPSRLESFDAVTETAPGELVIGTRRGLLRHRLGSSEPPFPIPDTEHVSVNHLAAGDDSSVWVGSRNGLLRLAATSGRLERLGGELADLDATHLWVERPDRIWIGSWGDGLWRYAPDRDELIRFSTTSSPALSDDFISQVRADPLGRYWVGTWNRGVDVLDEQAGTVINLHSKAGNEQSLPMGHVHSLLVDDRHVWVGTSFGLARIDVDSLQVQRIEIGLESGPVAVQRLTRDDRGYLWVATTRGLTRFDPRNGRQIAFGAADGLATTEFHARSGTITSGGAVVIGGVGGYVAFDPTAVTVDESPPTVAVTSVTIDDQPADPRLAAITVPPGSRELRIGYLVADYRDPGANRFRTRLVGREDTWSAASAGSEVLYAGLAPGDYRFEVTGANSHGIWADRAAGIFVQVEPYWYETAWGRSLALAALLLGIYGWHWQRTRRMRLANQRLELRVQEQTRELAHANEELRRAASTDFLTELPNRRGFSAMLRERFPALASGKLQACLALGDVDHFKSFNDHHGHDVGDIALRHVAIHAGAVVPSDATVARWGGEEFVIFFADTPVAEAQRLCEGINQRLAESDIFPGRDLPRVSITFGLAEYRPPESLDHWLDRADEAMYRGKRAGRNRVVVG